MNDHSSPKIPTRLFMSFIKLLGDAPADVGAAPGPVATSEQPL
jgi:hypothetical protein